MEINSLRHKNKSIDGCVNGRRPMSLHFSSVTLGSSIQTCGSQTKTIVESAMKQSTLAFKCEKAFSCCY